MITTFDDIRPYTDDEIPAAMRRIAQSEYLQPLAKFVFPEKNIEEIKELLNSFKSIQDFQVGVMYAFNKQVIQKSIENFTYCGFELLDPAKRYLFVSNHRDIVLDSSLLQNTLYDEGFRTTEISFGNNLMGSQLVIDIGNSNKMFKVARGGNAREFYENSLRLSQYIRYAITQKGESIWIAQRNGRTKDGNDATDQGIIKMFSMSNTQNLIQSLEELNIAPIAVSYQWEPCDIFKTRELYISRSGEKYVKQKDEDLISILTGITQQKGNVHFSICKPLEKEEYLTFANEKPNIFFSKIAGLVDARIYENYKLWSSNYIAQDLLSGTNQYAQFYTAEEKEQFMHRLHHALSQIEGDKEVISSIYLGIYANPVENRKIRLQ